MSKQGTPREPVWTEADLTYLRERYEQQEPLADIAAALGRQYKAVSTKASRIGLTTRALPRPWTEEEDAYLAANYQTVSTVVLARALGRWHGTIKQRADGLGLLSVKRRASAAIRHDYFAKIDSPVKAYVLGMLASDGYVSSGRNEIGIALHPKDGAIVALIRDQIAPLSPIGTRAEGMRVLRISSAQMRADLIRHGVTPRKSLTLQWPPDLPKHLENSYILGCFDGDGCLSYDAKRSYYQWSLVSASRLFLEEVRDRIRANTEVKISGPYAKSNGNRALSIHYTGPNIYALDEWLHTDVDGMARKRPNGRDIADKAARAPRGRRGRQRSTDTHCIRGHEFTPANTYIAPNGRRVCRTCKRQLNREWLSRQNATAG